MSWFQKTAENKEARFEVLLDVMEERMKREESILSTSPHKAIVNAIQYARVINSTLNSNLEKSVFLLRQNLEHEIRRIVDIQREALLENPQRLGTRRTFLRGYTRKQFRQHLWEALESKQRNEKLRRTKRQLCLPKLSPNSSSASCQDVDSPTPFSLTYWKHDSEAVYLPPI